MLHKLFVRYFSSAKRINDERFNELQAFVKLVMNDIPEEYLRAMRSDNKKYGICPAVGKQYWLGFTTTDYIWWETKFKTELLIIHPIAEIKKAFYSKLADLIDTNGFHALDPEIRAEFMDLVGTKKEL